MNPADNMNLIERLISFVSPSWGLEREIARQTLGNMQERAYEAAAHGRRTSNWWATGSSATTEASVSIKRLRDRSREMVRNNGWANKAIRVISNNVIGSGILLSVKVRKGNKNTATKIKDAWKDWADDARCDFDGRMNFYGLQKLMMRAVAEGGECLIVKFIDAKTQRLQIRLLEGDYIDTLKHNVGEQNSGQPFDFYGIRYDADGKRIGIWLYDRHPENGTYGSKLYDESQVIHVYEVLRAGQARGVPMGVSGFLRLRDYNDYEDAHLVRQKVAACYSVFVRNDTGGLPSAQKGTDPANQLKRIEPGTVHYLGNGQDITFATPPPVEGYDSYTRKILQGVAASYNITYEALTGDLSNVNFSSGRMGWIEYQRVVEEQQRDIMIPALSKVFAWFMDYLALSQGLKAEVVAEWTLPRREMIDPVKETNAMIAQIQAGLKSYDESLRELGYDPDDTLREIAEFNTKVDAQKIILTTDPRHKLQADKSADPTSG